MIEHFYSDIPGWFDEHFQAVYRDAVRDVPALKGNRPARVAEVGCWLGKSAAYMAVELANSHKRVVFYCVDHWKGSPDELDTNHKLATELSVYGLFQRNMLPAFGHYIPLEMSSVDAAAYFARGVLPYQFDFVFIDACHKKESVLSDLAAWWPLIRKGGRIAGHDFDPGHPGVMDAVRWFFGPETDGNFRVQGNCWIKDKLRE